MKITIGFSSIACITIMTAVVMLSCDRGSELVGGTTETTSARMYGTIWNDDSTRAAGALVTLIPAGYNAYTDAESVRIDSAFTNEGGEYAFTSLLSGYFNLIAQRDGKYCFKDSIAVSTSEPPEVADDTLRAFGAIEGNVLVAGGENPVEVIVLVLGTTVYGITDAASGAFSISYLAEGEYVIRMFTTAHLYSYLDTVVSVQAGKITKLEDVALPFVSIPEMDGVQSDYDARTMFVSFSWPAGDTETVAGYHIYRNTGIAGSPYVILENTETEFSDDLALPLLYGDTIRFYIATIGTNGTVQSVSAEQSIILYNEMIFVDSIPLPEFVRSWASTVRLHVDSEGNMYMVGWDNIVKIDPEGNLAARYNSNEDAYKALTVDAQGNVYVYKSLPHSKKLMKFNSDLEPVSDTALTEAPEPGLFNLVISPDGLIQLFIGGYGDSTVIHTFDPSLTLIKSSGYPYPWANPILHGDAVLHHDFSVDPVEKDTIMTIRDFDCNVISTKVIPNGHTTPVYPGTLVYQSGLSFSSGYYFTDDGRPLACGEILYVFEEDYSLAARCRVNGTIKAFDGRNRMYALKETRDYMYVYTID